MATLCERNFPGFTVLNDIEGAIQIVLKNQRFKKRGYSFKKVKFYVGDEPDSPNAVWLEVTLKSGKKFKIVATH